MRKITLITASIGVLLLSCSNRHPQTISEVGLPLEETNGVEKLPLENSIDISFMDFFELFMYEEEFQKSKIVFPFKKDNKIIQTAENWKHLPFYLNDMYMPILSSDTLTLYHKDVSSSKIELSIIDFKKKVVDKYNFEKINNEWFLLSSEKSSINSVPDFEFIDFLTKFSDEPISHVNHILFPLPVSILDIEGDFEIIEKTILREEWEGLEWWTINQLRLMVLSNIDTKNKYRTIHFRGIENGIAVLYTFEKINGNWKLIRLENYST